MPFKNREQQLEYYKQYRQTHDYNDYYKKYYNTPKGKKKNVLRKWKRRGILDNDLSSLYDYYLTQTYCWICFKEYKTTKDRCLDHDHETGEPRYICCQQCNLKMLTHSC